MSRLKICGINDSTFAVAAAQRGVDYLGFIFVSSSPRRVDAGTAREIAEAVRAAASADGAPPRLVGVFTESAVEDILSIARTVALDVIQLHSGRPDADVAAIKAHGYEVWRLWDGHSGSEDAVLLDGRSGNTSALADWKLGPHLKARGLKVVLAGKIGADNIEAARLTGADIVDVSSSLEIAPGVKSIALLERLTG